VFDPKTDTWRLGATCSVPRLYHSAAVLLPDGRVWTGGGNPRPGDEELRIETYTPGYCRAVDRPEIESQPRTVAYGSPFDIRVKSPTPIIESAIVRPSSVTHSFNVEQRWIGLEMLSVAANRITLRAPAGPEPAPPGWYMLTVLDEHRCPAAAQWVQVR